MNTFPKPTIKNVTLARLRDSLLPKLMRGEVRARDETKQVTEQVR